MNNIWVLVVAACCAAALATGSSMSVALHKRVHKTSIDQKTARHKMAYYGKVQAGSPPQEFTVVYDTGSGNLIVPGESCDSAACKSHAQFQNSKSTTIASINCDGSQVSSSESPDRVTITFGTGKITGACFTDHICVSSVCTPANFIVSTEESSMPFDSFAFDGILGLAMDSMAQSDEFSMMNRLHHSGSLKEPVFSVFLSDSDDEVSEITFGAHKNEHMASELYWVPVTSKAGYWEVEIEDIYLEKKPQNICQGCRVAVDTGTSELAGPSDVIDKLREKLTGDGCKAGTMPMLGFAVKGTSGNAKILSLSPQEYGDGGCSLSLMNLDVPPPKGPLFVFGIPFLQKYYTVYDHENDRVGFALAQHKGKTAGIFLEVDEPETYQAAPSSFLSPRIARSK